MRIAYFLRGAKNVMNKPSALEPNPGIGGTQYMVWYISYLLAQKKEMDIFMVTDELGINLPFLKNHYVNCVSDFLVFCKNEIIDIAVIIGHHITLKELKLIDYYKVKTIIWSHTLENYKQLNYYYKSDYIVKNICVSKEQMYRFYDHKTFGKSEYIFNTVNMLNYKSIIGDKTSNDPIITYIGNLYPNNGLEIIAEIWPKIEKKIPNAKLKIIGGNNLYNIKKSMTLIEKYKFYSAIKKGFYDENSNLKPNIEMTGVLTGFDKIKEMKNTTIGISNITPTGETFGIATIEFQLLNVPVFSMRKFGLLDTVNDGVTGYLCDNTKQLAEKIIYYLKNSQPVHTTNIGYDFISKKFDSKTIIDQWMKLFSKIMNGVTDIDDDRIDVKKSYKIYGKIKIIIPFLPSRIFYEYYINKVRRLFQKFYPF